MSQNFNSQFSYTFTKRNYNEMNRNSINPSTTIFHGNSFYKKGLYNTALKFGGPINQDLIIHHKANVRKSMEYSAAPDNPIFDFDESEKEKEKNKDNSLFLPNQNQEIKEIKEKKGISIFNCLNHSPQRKMNVEEKNNYFNTMQKDKYTQMHFSNFGNFYNNEINDNTKFDFKSEKRQTNILNFLVNREGNRTSVFNKEGIESDTKDNLEQKTGEEINLNDNNKTCISSKSENNKNSSTNNNRINPFLTNNNSCFNNSDKIKKFINGDDRNNNIDNKNLCENPFLAISKNKIENPFKVSSSNAFFNSINPNSNLNNKNAPLNPFLANDNKILNPFKKNNINPINPFANANINNNDKTNNTQVKDQVANNNPFKMNLNKDLNSNTNKNINNNNNNGNNNLYNPFLNNPFNKEKERENNNSLSNDNKNIVNPFLSIANNSNMNVNPFLNNTTNTNNNNPFFSNPFVSISNINSNQLPNNNNIKNEEKKEEEEEKENVEEEVKIEKDDNKLKKFKEIKYEKENKFFEIIVENLQYFDKNNEKNKYVSVGRGMLSLQQENKEGKKTGIFVLRDLSTKIIKIQGVIINSSTVEKAKMKNGLEYILVKNVLANFIKYTNLEDVRETILTYLRIKVNKDSLETLLDKINEFFSSIKN